MNQANTEFLEAAHLLDLEAIRRAKRAGADVDVRDARTGLTALHIAAGTNNLQLAKILTEEWKAAFGPDNLGRWPTTIAAQCGVSPEFCDYLVVQEAEFLRRANRYPYSAPTLYQ